MSITNRCNPLSSTPSAPGQSPWCRGHVSAAVETAEPDLTPDLGSASGLSAGDELRACRFVARGFGEITLSWTERGLRSLWWPACMPPPPLPPPAALPTAWAASLQRYFNGHQEELARLPTDLVGTPFQLRVWAELKRIPRGQVRSYASVATRIGAPRAMRAVGAANGANPLPIVVPCHRVVSSDGGLGGYSGEGGVATKSQLLELEGVCVVRGRVQPGQLQLL